MRLIDAEKLIASLKPEESVWVGLVLAEQVANAETVEAIPIEWIKGYITPFQVHHDSLSEELKENDGAGWVVDVLEEMLKEWEKETEDDNAYNDGLLRSINIINEQYSIPAVPIVKVWKKTTLTKEEIERAIGDASFCLYMQMMIEEEVERRIKKHESRDTKSIK